MPDFNYLKKMENRKYLAKDEKKKMEWTDPKAFSDDENDVKNTFDKGAASVRAENESLLKKISTFLFGDSRTSAYGSDTAFLLKPLARKDSEIVGAEVSPRLIPEKKDAGGGLKNNEIDLPKKKPVQDVSPSLESLPISPNSTSSKRKIVSGVQDGKGGAGNKWRSAASRLSLEANFVEDEQTYFFDWSKFFRIMAVGVFLVFTIINLLYWGMAFFDQSFAVKKKALDRQIADLEAEIAVNKGVLDDMVLFNRESDQVKNLLNSHIYQTNFFKFIEENTLKTVEYEDSVVSSNSDGDYVFSMGADRYEDMIGQLAVFRKHRFVKEVTLSDIRDNNGSDTTKKESVTVVTETMQLKPKRRISFKVNIKLDAKLYLKEN